MTGVLNGPGEGTWSVFAMKVVEERDEARADFANACDVGRRQEARAEKAERERDEARRDLGEILAVIHRDGGHHTGERGLSQSVADAHATCASVVRERDEARVEVERLHRLLSHATQSNPGTSVLVMLMDESREARAEVERLRGERDEARAHTSTAAFMRVERQRDEARAEVERLRAECDKASAMERHRIAEWMMRQAAIEASHGGLHGAVARSVLVALANAVLSGGHAE